eukprot:gene39121-41997_t
MGGTMDGTGGADEFNKRDAQFPPRHARMRGAGAAHAAGAARALASGAHVWWTVRGARGR